jgi:hypothetical protein
MDLELDRADDGTINECNQPRAEREALPLMLFDVARWAINALVRFEGGGEYGEGAGQVL